MAYFDGGLGNDVQLGTGGDDFMQGDEGDDQLNGGFGNDRLNGGSGDDNLSGHNGDDLLQGGAGNDLLFGGSGNDQMHGGYGADQFTFDNFNFSNGTVDTIQDFKRYEGDSLFLKNGVQITDVSYEQRDGTGPAMDVKITLTSKNGSTQTLWLDDAVRPGQSQSQLDSYFESLGYTDGGSTSF